MADFQRQEFGGALLGYRRMPDGTHAPIMALGNEALLPLSMMTPMEMATRERRAFVASTSMVSVTAGQKLFVTFANPADSGVNVMIQNRIFANEQSGSPAALEYQAYAAPTAVLSGLATSINLRGGTPPGAAVLRFQAAASGAITIGGTPGTVDVMPANGRTERLLMVVLEQGRSVGYVISGAGANLNNAARIGVTIDWYEEAA